jgi:zinc protease
VTAFEDANRVDGQFEVFATARPGHDLNELQAAIDADVRLLADSGPTAREVQRAQNGIEAQFLSRMERVGGVADQLNHYNAYWGAPDSFQKDLDRYLVVTPADVQRAARTYLASAHRVVLSVVPQGKPQLAVPEAR